MRSSTQYVKGRVGRFKPNHPNDDFSQAGALFSRVMSDQDRDNLIENIVQHLKNARRDIRERQIKVFRKCHPEYGSRIAKRLNMIAQKPRL